MESVDGHSSSTTPPVCTTKGGENGRRKVHEVAEQYDKAGVERRQAILVLFATASAHGALQTKCGNCPQIRASRFWTARISPGAACKSAPARRVHRLWEADLMLRGRGATRSCWPTEPLSAELFKLAAGNRRPCNESMCTQLYRDRRPRLGYLCTRGPFKIVSIIANSSSTVHNY